MAGSALNGIARKALDSLLPPRCALCGTISGAPHELCGDCWTELDFVTAPLCSHCGLPFDYEIAGRVRCGACLARPPGYDVARSALVYDGAARRLILAFKEHDRLELATLLAKWLRYAGAALLEDADMFIPVPLHRARLWQRRYNQAVLIARALEHDCGLPVDLFSLFRKRATKHQVGLNARQRQRNVRGAFAVAPPAKERLVGKRVVLVDDVYTTGATVEACSKTLKAAGAEFVSVLTVARVIKPQDATLN